MRNEGVKVHRNVGWYEAEKKEHKAYFSLHSFVFSLVWLFLLTLLHQQQGEGFPPSSTLRCRGLFRGSPPCPPCSAPLPEVSTLPVYPVASACPVSPAWTCPASRGGCLFLGLLPWQPCLRLLGGCCRTAALCWTIHHLEVTPWAAAHTAVSPENCFSSLCFLFYVCFFKMIWSLNFWFEVSGM